MRNLVFLLLGFLLLVLQSTLATLLNLEAVTPHLLLPLVIHLGVSPDVDLVRGVSLAFLLGYLLDSFCGSPMGLQTFVAVATFILARGAGTRLFLRGVVFQTVMTFSITFAANLMIFALRAIFEKPAPFPWGNLLTTLRWSLLPAAITALVAPLVFWLVRRLDSWASRQREASNLPA